MGQIDQARCHMSDLDTDIRRFALPSTGMALERPLRSAVNNLQIDLRRFASLELSRFRCEAWARVVPLPERVKRRLSIGGPPFDDGPADLQTFDRQILR
jgi:hypothetical protein